MPDEGRPVPLSRPRFRFCPGCGAELEHGPPVTCAACGATHWRNAKPCAGALVTHDGRLLLIRRAIEPWQGAWDIPGGFCEADEHPRDAAVREVREETGLAVTVTGLLGMWVDSYGEGDGADHTLNCYFHARLAGSPTVTVDPAEAIAAAWFGPDALPEEIAFPGHARSVLNAWRAAAAAGALEGSVPGTD